MCYGQCECVHLNLYAELQYIQCVYVSLCVCGTSSKRNKLELARAIMKCFLLGFAYIVCIEGYFFIA